MYGTKFINKMVLPTAKSNCIGQTLLKSRLQKKKKILVLTLKLVYVNLCVCVVLCV